MIPAFDAIRAINDQRGEAIVVTTMTPTRYWHAVSKTPDLDLPIFGGMGKAPSVGLGLALAHPNRKVVILDGDGGLLMNLGSLITTADQEPANLIHFVFQDGVYFTTGSQPLPGSDKFNLSGIAKEAGINESYSFDNLEDFVSELPSIMEKEGPVFVCLKVNHSGDVPPFQIRSTRDAMKRLSKTLREQ